MQASLCSAIRLKTVFISSLVLVAVLAGYLLVSSTLTDSKRRVQRLHWTSTDKSSRT